MKFIDIRDDRDVYLLEPGTIFVPDVSSSDLRDAIRDRWSSELITWIFVGIAEQRARFLNFKNNYYVTYPGRLEVLSSRIIKHAKGVVIVYE